MSNGPINISTVVTATTGAVDAAATQGGSPSSINATQLNINLASLAATAGSFLPGGLGTAFGLTGQTASGVGLGISVGQLFTANNPADRASAGLAALAGLAGVIAGIPLVPPPVRLSMLLAQSALTAIAGAIGSNADYVNQKIDDLSKILDGIGDALDKLPQAIKDLFDRGLNWFWRGDPLVLDLNGNGIQLTVENNTILFDHNADGINTGTQWVKSDDGILVRDLNANGTIDSGRELFGDNTRLSNGQLATNGFQALADLDSNGDGVFDATDATYTELKVWRDLNQDGISQANELQTLADAGITSINLSANAQGASTFTKDGTTHAVQNVNFATNNFFSEFTDNPVVTASAADLPQMQGAGQVRNLREAMSLGTPQAATLQTALEAFKAAGTAQDRQALADAVITAWANTSSMGDAKTRNPVLLNKGYGNSPADAIAAFANSQPAHLAGAAVALAELKDYYAPAPELIAARAYLTCARGRKHIKVTHAWAKHSGRSTTQRSMNG